MKNRSGRLLIVLVLLATFLRFFLIAKEFHVDTYAFAEWGERIYQFGPKGFYGPGILWLNSDPTQPPVANLWYALNAWFYHYLVWLFTYIGFFIAHHHLGAAHILWYYDFVSFFSSQLFKLTPIHTGQLIVLKIAPITADILIGLIIYLLTRTYSKKRALALTAVYLLTPFSWYLSSLWGQIDQLAALIFLIATVMLYKKRFLSLVVPLCALSVMLKPTTLIFVPVLGLLFLQAKISWSKKLISILATILVAVVITTYFANENTISFITGPLYSKIFDKSEYRLSTLSFNLWYLVLGNKLMNQNLPILFIPGKYWGYGAYLVLNIFAGLNLKRNPQKGIFISMFLIGFGSWLFVSNMAERYAFTGLMMGLVAAGLEKRFIKPVIALLLIFSLNLYFSWLYPGWLDFLHHLLDWQQDLIPRLFSLLNLVIFIKILLILKSQRLKIPES